MLIISKLSKLLYLPIVNPLVMLIGTMLFKLPINYQLLNYEKLYLVQSLTLALRKNIHQKPLQIKV